MMQLLNSVMGGNQQQSGGDGGGGSSDWSQLGHMVSKFESADVNGDGKVDYKDFISM